MYVFNHHTTIGGMDFSNIISFSIQKALDEVIDRAQLLMATSFNRRVLNEQYDFFKTGQYCSICLGYNDIIPLNFTGYLARRTVNEEDNLLLEFWDMSYFFFHTRIHETSYVEKGILTSADRQNPNIAPLLARTVENFPTDFGINLDDNPPHDGGIVEVDNGTMEKLLAHWLRIVNGKGRLIFGNRPITLNISDRVKDIKIGDLQFPAVSLLDALNIIKRRFFLNIYFRRNVLHVHPILSSEVGDTIKAPTFEDGVTGKTVPFHFQRNIQTQASLQFLEKRQNPIQVSVYSYDNVGGVERETAGDRTGQTFYVNVNQGEVSEETALRLHENLQYDGFTGHFNAFLRPYVSFGNNVELIDGRLEEHMGTYLVRKTNTFVQGTVNYRQVFLSRRVDG